MIRLSPRIERSLQATFASPGVEKVVNLVDIGLGGAAVSSNPNMEDFSDIEDKPLWLNIPLEGDDPLQIHCTVVHKQFRTIGFSFVGVEKSDQQMLWGKISRWINDPAKCLYCGNTIASDTTQCPHCGWKLNFQASGYFSYWQKEHLCRSIMNDLKALSLEDLMRIKKQLIEPMPQEIKDTDTVEEFVGVSPAMLTVFNHIRKVAPTDLPVLILGETGTGKELTARAVLERSHRSENPFVVINCSAIPESLLESELFGHTKGAFTGAIQTKKGKFEHADKGTLFLDEIGEMPLSLQPKLLRFLEDKIVYRIGATRGRILDVRIIAATNVDLTAAIQAGQFRRDLYHRIASFPIHLPPLRERDDCKEILAKYFLKKIKMERGWKCLGFGKEALEAIVAYPWPGNVREMINRIRRAVVVQDEWIRPEDLGLPFQKRIHEKMSVLKAADEEQKRTLLNASLEANQYNISRTARALDISRPYVYKLIKRLDISVPHQK
jgi:transcriptional regulator with GAF, ATPase, and Fis domain